MALTIDEMIDALIWSTGFPPMLSPSAGAVSERDRFIILELFYGIFGDNIPEDMVEGALARMIEQFKPADNLKAVIRIFAEECQELEDAIVETILYKNLAVTESATLDLYGELFNVPRNGRLDGPYRTAIEFKIRQLRSAGDGDLVIDSVLALTESDDVILNELFPAGVTIQFNGILTTTGSELYGSIKRLLSAGVALDALIWSEGDGSDFFNFADEGGVPNLPGKGYNEDGYSPDVGGKYSEGLS